ncbi:hypothetical protein K466DRAFT_135380 [Polyporus arcularius HHB13444]|uniref:Uncharacterized protein n=1 Tax=Polyporus arcularius HHB13444 TaxID=1314778 RepID=A0A5C3PB32_9APHY|nr:hypothetical protein K466DRAFT_135380 [Polyporus arcularius HHB13444]
MHPTSPPIWRACAPVEGLIEHIHVHAHQSLGSGLMIGEAQAQVQITAPWGCREADASRKPRHSGLARVLERRDGETMTCSSSRGAWIAQQTRLRCDSRLHPADAGVPVGWSPQQARSCADPAPESRVCWRMAAARSCWTSRVSAPMMSYSGQAYLTFRPVHVFNRTWRRTRRRLQQLSRD